MKIFIQIVIALLLSIPLFGKDKIELRPVNYKELDKIFNSADSIVVLEEPFSDSKILFASNNYKEIQDLKESLILEIPKPDTWMHCMCLGTPAIYLYKDTTKLIQITNHHGNSIRCSLWDTDVIIKDVEKWLTWFDNRSIISPREEVEDSRIRAIKSQINYNRWLSKMPGSIRLLWDSIDPNDFNPDITPLNDALTKEFPNSQERILTLLRWYGSGTGPWSGFPIYEDIALKILLEYQTQDIIKAIQSTKLDSMQTEGSARLFGGWYFQKQHPDGSSLIPKDLKLLFWEHIKITTDKDKFDRAQKAFAQ